MGCSVGRSGRHRFFSVRIPFAQSVQTFGARILLWAIEKIGGRSERAALVAEVQADVDVVVALVGGEQIGQPIFVQVGDVDEGRVGASRLIRLGL